MEFPCSGRRETVSGRTRRAANIVPGPSEVDISDDHRCVVLSLDDQRVLQM